MLIRSFILLHALSCFYALLRFYVLLPGYMGFMRTFTVPKSVAATLRTVLTPFPVKPFPHRFHTLYKNRQQKPKLRPYSLDE